MTSKIKTGLLAGASTLALGLMVAAAPASAFDTVNWTWDAAITETVTKDVTITIDMAPTGMVMLEDLQVQIGDVTATSTVSNIRNVQPTAGNEGGTVDFGVQDFQFQYGLGGEGVMVLENDFKSDNILSATVDESDTLPNINGTVIGTFDLGEVEIPASEALSFDALTELPAIVSSATAVANNTSITSDVGVQLHEGQFSFNTSGETGNGVLAALADADLSGGNRHQTAAGLLTLAALGGEITSANISATSTVSDILNATVDSSATAVANNLTVNVVPKTDADALLIGDAVQFSFASVNATSDVSDIRVRNYTGLGGLTGPMISSVATAVGNNKSITVQSPVVVTP